MLRVGEKKASGQEYFSVQRSETDDTPLYTYSARKYDSVYSYW